QCARHRNWWCLSKVGPRRRQDGLRPLLCPHQLGARRRHAWVMTGYDFPPADSGLAAIKPGFGSILARQPGPNNPPTGLPPYLRLSGIYGDSSAWLGPAYAPFDTSGRARTNMDLRVALDRLSDRKSLLRTFDTLDRRLDRSGLVQGLDSFELQAFELILSR